MFAQVIVGDGSAGWWPIWPLAGSHYSGWGVAFELAFIGFALLVTCPLWLGMVMINEHQVGIVIKKFGTRKLAPGQLIALHGEAGYQADTLAPGLHFGYWIFQYRVQKDAMVRIPRARSGSCWPTPARPLCPSGFSGGQSRATTSRTRVPF